MKKWKYQYGGSIFDPFAYGGGGFMSEQNQFTGTTGQSVENTLTDYGYENVTPNPVSPMGHQPLYGQADFQQTSEGMYAKVQPVEMGGNSSSFDMNSTMGSYGNAIGAAGTMAAGSIQSGWNQNMVDTHGTGPSTGQSLVGAAGPWGAAISGVSQMGTSIGDSISGGVDPETGKPYEGEAQYQAGQNLSYIFSPSSQLEDTLTDEYLTDSEKLFQGFHDLTGTGWMTKEYTDKKSRERAAEAYRAEQERIEREGREARFKQREAYASANRGNAFTSAGNTYLNPTALGMAHGGYMGGVDGGNYLSPNDVNSFETGGSHESNPHGGIPQGPNATVEQGEVSLELADGKYIFSDRLTLR